MALSGRIITNAWTADSGNTFKVACDWTATQNIANNTSTISWKILTVNSSSGWVAIGELRLKFGSEQIYYRSYTTVTDYATNGTVLASGTKTITHSADGSKSFTATLEAGIYEWAINKSGSATVTLNQIPRQATITSAPNFNDENNPTINYSNPAGTAVTSLQACISFTGAAADIAYRDISKTGTSYTFNLTEAERNVLRNKFPNSNTGTVIFYVKTVIGSNTFYSTSTKTLTIVNANPTLTCSAVDTNSTTLALTGNSSKWVRYHSTITRTVSATPLKGASIKSTTGAGTTTKVNQSSFSFTATDSRGNSTTKTVTGTLIPYVELSLQFKPRVAVDGTVTIAAKGNYFNGSFGSVTNTLTLQYRYKKSGGSYTSWTSYSAAISGNAHNTNIVFTIPSFDYQASYVFQVRVSDKLATVTPKEYTANALPVFDWGADDFNFNVPVKINGNLEVTGTITQNNEPMAVEVEEPYSDYVVSHGTASMGTNGTWYWRKWNSGRADCYGCRNYGNMGVSTAWGNLFRSESFSQTFPSGLFISTPEVIDITYRGSNYGGWIAQHEATTASASNSGGFIMVRPASATLSQVYLGFNVIGRWK